MLGPAARAGQEGVHMCVRGTVSPKIADCLSEVTSLCQTFVPPRTASVSGDAVLYRSLTTLARALAQYLLLFPKLPGHLHLPPEKERDTVKFVVATLEVRGSGTWCPCEQGRGRPAAPLGRRRKAVCLGALGCAQSGAPFAVAHPHLPAGGLCLPLTFPGLLLCAGSTASCCWRCCTSFPCPQN